MSYIHMKIIVNMVTTNFATLVSFLLYSNLSEYNIFFLHYVACSEVPEFLLFVYPRKRSLLFR